MLAILFWVCLLLMLVGAGFQGSSWKGAPYVSWGLAFVAFVILGLKVFGFQP